MIINSMADAQVQANDLVTFNPRPISYSVKGSKNTLSGTIPANQFAVFDAQVTGSPPYEVTLGYVNHSYQAKPVVVDRNDVLLTFWMAFPAGPNGPTTFTYIEQG